MGMGAPADFVHELESLANTHHEKAFLDVMRACVLVACMHAYDQSPMSWCVECGRAFASDAAIDCALVCGSLPHVWVPMCRYHFGARYVVEMEIVMPGDMTVAESHDIALELQHKVRRIPTAFGSKFLHITPRKPHTAELRDMHCWLVPFGPVEPFGPACFPVTFISFW